jgi:hypothetical protein
MRRRDLFLASAAAILASPDRGSAHDTRYNGARPDLNGRTTEPVLAQLDPTFKDLGKSIFPIISERGFRRRTTMGTAFKIGETTDQQSILVTNVHNVAAINNGNHELFDLQLPFSGTNDVTISSVHVSNSHDLAFLCVAGLTAEAPSLTLVPMPTDIGGRKLLGIGFQRRFILALRQSDQRCHVPIPTDDHDSPVLYQSTYNVPVLARADRTGDPNQPHTLSDPGADLGVHDAWLGVSGLPGNSGSPLFDISEGPNSAKVIGIRYHTGDPQGNCASGIFITSQVMISHLTNTPEIVATISSREWQRITAAFAATPVLSAPLTLQRLTKKDY